MTWRKATLLLLILGFGATVETAWQVRDHVSLGPLGCRVLAGRFYGPSFAFEAEDRQAVAAGTAVEIGNAFGAVRVSTGEPGEVRVHVRKVVFRPTEAEARTFADRIRLQLRSEGGVLKIGTNRPELESADVGFETHLHVTLPPDSALTVRNEHGAVEAIGVASADLWSSFDAVRAERVAGPVVARNRHGDIQVVETKGGASLSVRNGDVEVRDVLGPVTVDLHHGDLTAARVGGLIVQVQHGDVRAETVSGDLELHGRHAGLEASGITGRATVETSFRDVEIEQVAGAVQARTEHGNLSVREAKGAVSAESAFGDITLAQIGGPAAATTKHGGVRGEGLAAGARVRASGDEVALIAFAGPVEVQAERGSVHLVPAGPIQAPLTVTSQHGGIHLEVPSGSRFELDAASSSGEVSMEVSGLLARTTEPRHVVATLGGGGSLVKLSAQRGNVRLRDAAVVADQRP